MGYVGAGIAETARYASHWLRSPYSFRKFREVGYRRVDPTMSTGTVPSYLHRYS